MKSKSKTASPVAPPPLPSRQGGSSSLWPDTDAPPAYASISGSSDMYYNHDDPRASSMQSLVPSDSNAEQQRRRLLLIYLHGFMGDETSFRSFPAHVHNLITILLAETHVVHTKIYPRYRSKRNISFARDDFSKWLEPHEGANTDIILLGHSMGGLLSSEVVLMPSSAPANRPLKHRILGTINFDVPFLGMHPGVVKSGLASIFRSAEELGDQWSDTGEIYSATDVGSTSTSTLASDISMPPNRNDTLWHPSRPDPNLNPSFANDVVLPVRTGWRNALHFVHKHSNNMGELTKATKKLVSSHLEFGGAMANYPELRTRYCRIRALEEPAADVRKSLSGTHNETLPRVRFVNYYTASAGHMKKEKKAKSPRLLSPNANRSRASLTPSTSNVDTRGRRENGISPPRSARSRSPRISLEEYSAEGVQRKQPDLPESEDEDWEDAAETLTIGDTLKSITSRKSSANISPTPPPASTLPVVDSQSASGLPITPPPLDVSYIQDPSTRRLVEMEHERAVKAYEQAMRNYEKTGTGGTNVPAALEAGSNEAAARAGAVEMTHQENEAQRLQVEKQRMEIEARRLRGEDEPALERKSLEQAPTLATQTSYSSSPSSIAPSHSTEPSSISKKKVGEHKFCTLPPKDSSGERDRTWVRVYMENVDEVGAHCGLFFVDERYERLVGDVAERIEKWVKEDGDLRVAAEFDLD